MAASIDADGSVSLTYNCVGQQAHINPRFTTLISGTVENGILRAAGRADSAGVISTSPQPAVMSRRDWKNFTSPGESPDGAANVS